MEKLCTFDTLCSCTPEQYKSGNVLMRRAQMGEEWG